MTDRSPDDFNAAQAGTLPDLLGLETLEVSHGYLRMRFEVKPHHLAPNGYLHAASLVALMDSAAGYGCMASLPDGANGFTTIELKSNFLGTVLEGGVVCEARMAHGGRMTQVWDVEARREDNGKTLALFRCTQMILHPR